MKRVLILLTVSSALWLPVSAGALPAEGLSMNVLFFDGKSGYVQLPPNIFDHLTQGTVEAWVKWERGRSLARQALSGDERIYPNGFSLCQRRRTAQPQGDHPNHGVPRFFALSRRVLAL